MGRLFDWIKITCRIVCVIFTKRCVPITLDSCEEEIIREAVQRTVEDFKYIDLEKYKVLNPAIPFKALLGQLLLRAVFAYFA